jgi:hypothetical protein
MSPNFAWLSLLLGLSVGFGPTTVAPALTRWRIFFRTLSGM